MQFNCTFWYIYFHSIQFAMMRKFILLTLLTLSLAGCSVMKKQMMRRMSKMSEDEKMEMMSEMMRGEDNTSCNDMMSKMSRIMMNDSLSKPEMAQVMLPLCIEGILAEVEPEYRADYLADIIKEVLMQSYDSIPVDQRKILKEDLHVIIEDLD